MTSSASFSVLGSEFDDFLYAPIGEDSNGMLLSVLSALARLDVDPWQEAAKLARLPGETAIQDLASLIAALPDRPSAELDTRTTAARLIALLPRRASYKIQSRERQLGVGAITYSRVVIYAIFMVFLLSAQLIMASRLPSSQVDDVQTQASSAVSPQAK
jgi:hypothetical protein